MPKLYRSFSGTLVDPEKQRYLDGDDSDSESAPSLVSSRDSSGSWRPMLGNPHSPTSSISRAYWAYHLPRRRFSRYFTLLVASSLFFFILFLVKASWISQAQVRAGAASIAHTPPAWEQFPFLQRYYGGIRTLIDQVNNVIEYPVSEEVEAQRLEEASLKRLGKEDDPLKAKQRSEKREEDDWRSKLIQVDPFSSDHDSGIEPRVTCSLNGRTNSSAPQLLGYHGIPEGFPDPIMGSHGLFGLRNDVCFERYGRLGPYGFGYSTQYGGVGAGMHGHVEAKDATWADQMEIDWSQMRWAQAQDECLERNNHRFSPEGEDLETSRGRTGKKLVARTAVLVRTWSDYTYDPEDVLYLRALINELSIQTGGEYVVHFLIHVKDDNLQIWADDELYQRVLQESLPEEFRGMGTLWSERQMGLVYGGVSESFYRDLPVHGVYRSVFMSLQYFAHSHPEYDYFWNWEMDIRYTGHFYELFDKVTKWAKQQPRKGLWERNGRFYVPSEHGDWADFRQMVRIQTEHGTASKESIYAKIAADANTKPPLDKASRQAEKPVWGPVVLESEGEKYDTSHDPVPPTSPDKDNYSWGVGEDADLITFNPLFDPEGTNWYLSEDMTGYNTTESNPPRRAAIITASRLSRRLLETMHRETAFARHTMFSEMWPASCALHHGLKAVYAPLPVYIDRAWPSSYLAAIFNNGRNGASGGARTSVFSEERQHNFQGLTWYYNAGFGPNLWKRWLGYKVNNDGGEEQELEGEGRMCLPAMLLHPIKQIDLVIERQDE